LLGTSQAQGLSRCIEWALFFDTHELACIVAQGGIANQKPPHYESIETLLVTVAELIGDGLKVLKREFRFLKDCRQKVEGERFMLGVEQLAKRDVDSLNRRSVLALDFLKST
jgi:hypothetical protein